MTDSNEEAGNAENPPVAGATRPSEGSQDPMGFAGLGEYFLNGTKKVYVRHRQRPSADPIAALSQEVERMLNPLLGKGGDTLPSVGGFARAGLTRLETAREWMCSLPNDHRTAVAKIIIAAWQGGQNQTIALLRDSGLLNATQGVEMAIRMKAIRAKTRENAELLHPADKRNFPKMRVLIEAASRSGKRLSERDAAHFVLFPDLPDIPENAAGAKKRREIDSMRKRYRRWKMNLGR